MKFLDKKVFLIELFLEKVLDLGVVIEFLLMFLLFELGFGLDDLVELLDFGHFCSQNLMLGLYETVEEGAGLYFLNFFLDVLVVHWLYYLGQRCCQVYLTGFKYYKLDYARLNIIETLQGY
jgi:hypothetical protein